MDSALEPIIIELLPIDDPCLEILSKFSGQNYLQGDTKKKIECAGKAFDTYYQLKESTNYIDEKEEVPALEEEKEEKLFSGQWAQKRKKMSKEETAKQSLFKDNYYEILGLENVGLAATDADVKSAYRKLATLYHPDKVAGHGNSAEKIEAGSTEAKSQPAKVNKDIWTKIQKAYEVLSSSDSRKQYDSSLPFDDTIPSDSEDINDDNFFDAYFCDNKMALDLKLHSEGMDNFRRSILCLISVILTHQQMVLGNSTTSGNYHIISKLTLHRDNFQSWRDFSLYDEYNLKEAESRLEKRWMEKENKKIREKYVKEERARINRLVSLAKD